MKKSHLLGAMCACLVIVSFNANAALIGRLPATLGGIDYQAYYDTDADLTWLEDANTTGTTMNWEDARVWALGLDVNGVSGWRLPGTLQPDASCAQQTNISYGYDCTGSELGNLFYNVLGNEAGVLATNSGPFSNVQPYYYWSSTPVRPFPGYAYVFSMSYGFTNYGAVTTPLFYGWAVHSGDVGPVPVPAAVWLFGSGLLGLVGIGRRKKA